VRPATTKSSTAAPDGSSGIEQISPAQIDHLRAFCNEHSRRISKFCASAPPQWPKRRFAAAVPAWGALDASASLTSPSTLSAPPSTTSLHRPPPIAQPPTQYPLRQQHPSLSAVWPRPSSALPVLLPGWSSRAGSSPLLSHGLVVVQRRRRALPRRQEDWRRLVRRAVRRHQPAQQPAGCHQVCTLLCRVTCP
jgi:hypothetical protein